MEQHSGLLNAGEVANLLGLDVSTIRRWTSMKRIPYIKFSARAVRYDPVRIRQWLQASIVENKE